MISGWHLYYYHPVSKYPQAVGRGAGGRGWGVVTPGQGPNSSWTPKFYGPYSVLSKPQVPADLQLAGWPVGGAQLARRQLALAGTAQVPWSVHDARVTHIRTANFSCCFSCRLRSNTTQRSTHQQTPDPHKPQNSKTQSPAKRLNRLTSRVLFTNKQTCEYCPP